MIVLKCLRVRLFIFFVLLALIWIAFYYFLKSSPKEEIADSSKMVMLNGDRSAVVDISVYYECLCPDSRSFFVKQLLPAVEKIPNFLRIDFVPYGKAETKIIGPSKYEFTCQHGPQECLGNKIHSCSLLKLSDGLMRTKLLTCMISGKLNPEESGKKCAEMFKLDWKSIWECAEGSVGDELLKISGEKTHALDPKVTFIPTVLLNNEFGNQAAILKDLFRQVCLKLEKALQFQNNFLPLQTGLEEAHSKMSKILAENYDLTWSNPEEVVHSMPINRGSLREHKSVVGFYSDLVS